MGKKISGSSSMLCAGVHGFSDSTTKEKSELSADGMAFYHWNKFLKSLDSNWTYISAEDSEPEALQGWFYYKQALPENGVTTALLKALQTNYNNNYYDISDFQLIVYSETVQAVDETGELIQQAEDIPAWKIA